MASATKTHVGCPSCRLRFTAPAAAYLVVCPECGRAPQPIGRAQEVVGFRLCAEEDVRLELPEAVAALIPIADPGGGPS
jgi:predicted RNA-binding Zn-ribbon protein involved in translation (DUF1610 family)